MAQFAMLTSERLQSRNSNFFSGPRQVDCEEFAVSLRKCKRFEITSRKRQMYAVNPCETPIPKDSQYKTTATRENLSFLSSVLEGYSSETDLVLALRTLKNIYIISDKLAFKITMTLPIISSIISIATNAKISNECLKEATWCLCNIASGPSYIIKSLIEKDIINICMNLLEGNDKQIIESSIWCLGNIASDCAEYRKKILETNFFEYLLSNYLNLQFMLSALLWTFQNLLEGGFVVKESHIKTLLKYLNDTIKTKSESIISNVLLVVSNLSDGNLNSIQVIIENKILKKIIKFAKSSNIKICFPCIRIIGNLVSGTGEQTQKILDLNILDILYAQFEKFESNKIKNYIMWTMSNICSGTRSQILQVTNHPILIKIVNSINSCERVMKKEALNCVMSIIKLGANTSVFALINVGVMKETKELLENSLDNELIQMALENIFLILKTFENCQLTEVIAIMEKSCMIEMIKHFSSKNSKIENTLKKINSLLEPDSNEYAFSFT